MFMSSFILQQQHMQEDVQRLQQLAQSAEERRGQELEGLKQELRDTQVKMAELEMELQRARTLVQQQDMSIQSLQGALEEAAHSMAAKEEQLQGCEHLAAELLAVQQQLEDARAACAEHEARGRERRHAAPTPQTTYPEPELPAASAGAGVVTAQVDTRGTEADDAAAPTQDLGSAAAAIGAASGAAEAAELPAPDATLSAPSPEAAAPADMATLSNRLSGVKRMVPGALFVAATAFAVLNRELRIVF